MARARFRVAAAVALSAGAAVAVRAVPVESPDWAILAGWYSNGDNGQIGFVLEQLKAAPYTAGYEFFGDITPALVARHGTRFRVVRVEPVSRRIAPVGSSPAREVKGVKVSAALVAKGDWWLPEGLAAAGFKVYDAEAMGYRVGYEFYLDFSPAQ